VSRQESIILDIGSDYIAALRVGGGRDFLPENRAIRSFPEGFRNGAVVNLDQATRSLDSLLAELFRETADAMSKIKPKLNVNVVVGNPESKVFTYSSSIYFHGSSRSIQSQDVRAVIEQTRGVATLPLCEHILQSFPVSFVVNDIEGVKDPVGLDGSRLGVTLKILTMHFEEFKNIQKALDHAEIEAEAFYPKILTSSHAILTDQEKEEGALVIDIDHGSTFCTLWNHGEIVDSRALPLGDSFLVMEIAKEWSLNEKDAKKVKERYSSMNEALDFGDELIPLIIKGGEEKCTIRRQEFHEKFLAMSRKWLAILNEQLDGFVQETRCFYPSYVFLGSGVVSDHFLEFLNQQIGMNARVGVTRCIEAPQEILLNQSLIPSLGLLGWLREEEALTTRISGPQTLLQKTVGTARNWFSNYF